MGDNLMEEITYNKSLDRRVRGLDVKADDPRADVTNDAHRAMEKLKAQADTEDNLANNVMREARVEDCVKHLTMCLVGNYPVDEFWWTKSLMYCGVVAADHNVPPTSNLTIVIVRKYLEQSIEERLGMEMRAKLVSEYREEIDKLKEQHRRLNVWYAACIDYWVNIMRAFVRPSPPADGLNFIEELFNREPKMPDGLR